MKLTKNEVDRLVEIRNKIKKLKAEEIKLSEKIKDFLDLKENVSQKGNKYEIYLSSSDSTEIDNKKCFGVIGKHNFIEIAKLSVTKLKKFCSEKDFNKFTTVILDATLKIKSRPIN